MDEITALRLQEFLERTTDLVGVTDDSGNVVYVNDATRRRLGLGTDAPRGLTTADLFPESAFSRYFEEVRPTLLQSGVWSGVIPVRTAGGGSMDAWLTIVGGVGAGGDIEWLVTSGRDITEWVHDRDALRWHATHDELTGAARRVVLVERLQGALARARRTGDWVGVLFIDVNNFKSVNDTLGHHAGDEALVEIAQRARNAIREVDTLARVGGDEFVVVIEGLTEEAHAEAFADRLKAQVTDRPVHAGRTEITLSISIGLVLGDGASDANQLLHEADHAMYEAKRRPDTPVSAQWVGARRDGPHSSVHPVSVALTQQLITPQYQPVVDLKDGTVVGYQALARWGGKPASEFVDAVRDTGVAIALDLAILRRLTADVRDWGPVPPGSVYVHLSSRFFADPRGASHLAELLQQNAVSPESLVLELTASALLGSGREVAAMLRPYHALGLRVIASHARHYNPETMASTEGLIAGLLFERSLIGNIEKGGSRIEELGALVAGARAAGMVTIATGVETRAEHQRLTELGCALGIGHLFGMPEAPPTPQ